MILEKQISKLLKEYKKARKEIEINLTKYCDETSKVEKGELLQINNIITDLQNLQKLCNTGAKK